MNRPPRIEIRARGRYVNIDADNIEIGYLTLTRSGEVDRAWAYEFGNRWIVDAVGACYEAVHAAGADLGLRPFGGRHPIGSLNRQGTKRAG